MPYNDDVKQAIKSFIQTNYAGMTVDQIMTSLYTPHSYNPPQYKTQPIEKGTFLLAIAPAVITLASLDAAIKDKWDRVLALINASPDQVEVNNPVVQAIFSMAVSDGLMTQDQINGIIAISQVEILETDMNNFVYQLTVQDVEEALES